MFNPVWKYIPSKRKMKYDTHTQKHSSGTLENPLISVVLNGMLLYGCSSSSSSGWNLNALAQYSLFTMLDYCMVHDNTYVKSLHLINILCCFFGGYRTETNKVRGERWKMKLRLSHCVSGIRQTGRAAHQPHHTQHDSSGFPLFWLWQTCIYVHFFPSFADDVCMGQT